MEFKNIRLGPALKIVGYSSYLRAKNRILALNNTPFQSGTPSRSSSSKMWEPKTPSQLLTNPPPRSIIYGNAGIKNETPSDGDHVVRFKNFPVAHKIDEAIPLHKNESLMAENSNRPFEEPREQRNLVQQGNGVSVTPHPVEC